MDPPWTSTFSTPGHWREKQRLLTALAHPVFTGVIPLLQAFSQMQTQNTPKPLSCLIFLNYVRAPTLCAPYLLTKFIDMESIESFWVSVGRYDGGSSRVRQNSEFFIRHTAGKIQAAKSHFRIWDRDNLHFRHGYAICIYSISKWNTVKRCLE